MRWIWDWAKYHNSYSSKSIRVTKLPCCQNGVFLGRSFWPKDSLVTFILFELWLLWYLAQSQIHRIPLYTWTDIEKYFSNHACDIMNIYFRLVCCILISGCEFLEYLSWGYKIFLSVVQRYGRSQFTKKSSEYI